MPDYQRIGGLLQALNDPTRRAVLERLAQGPASVSQLAQPFQMALPSFMQHLDVLEKAGLAQSQKVGRVRTYTLHGEALTELIQWLQQQRTVWERQFDQLDQFLIATKEADQ